MAYDSLKLNKEIELVFTKGKRTENGCLKAYSYLLPATLNTRDPTNLFMISVGKKLFKRANKRNLLKRRVREAYRIHSIELPILEDQQRIAIAFVYTSKEILSWLEISASVKEIITYFASHHSRPRKQA